jgi:hypothetical protein
MIGKEIDFDDSIQEIQVISHIISKDQIGQAGHHHQCNSNPKLLFFYYG